jgi:hypothetical protein
MHVHCPCTQNDSHENMLGVHMVDVTPRFPIPSVVNWLSSDNPGNQNEDDRTKVCTMCTYLDVVIVANSILSVLAKHREQTGHDLHARIGIGAGEVISGVMGRLQPRFCVYGDAMVAAAEHERLGTADTVHCSQEFFDTITMDMCSGHCYAHLQHKIDGIRLVNRMVQEGKLRVCKRASAKSAGKSGHGNGNGNGNGSVDGNGRFDEIQGAAPSAS